MTMRSKNKLLNRHSIGDRKIEHANTIRPFRLEVSAE